MSTVTKRKSGARERRQAEEKGFRADVPRCPKCKERVEEVARWATFGGSGFCGDCEPTEGEKAAAHASKNGPASREAGQVLSTTTPAGIAALDPEAVTPSTASKPANDTRSLQPDRKDDPHERRPYSDLLANLGRNRFNPRERFDEAELDELAESLQKHGQIQPVVIRHLPQGVSVPSIADPAKTVSTEIVAGERRALAALRAGWKRINVMAISCDDARACELAIAENRDRRDISQVEYARGLKRLAELKELGPEQLARDQGISEQHVRNLFRLLDAPPAWQQRVIDGVLSGTHLRHALPFLHVEAIEKDLLKHVEESQIEGRFAESEKKWRRKIEDVVRERGVKLRRWVTVREPEYKSIEVRIDPKDPRYAELDVIELAAPWGGGKEKFALNRQAANAILSEKAKAWKARHGAKKDKPKGAEASEEKKLTAAQQKKRAQAAADEHKANLKNLVEGWLCWQCAHRVKDDPATAELILLAIALGASRLFDEGSYLHTEWKDFLDDRKRQEVLAKYVSNQFYGAERRCIAPWPNVHNWDAGIVELRYWCAELEVDPAAAWRAKDDDGKQQFLGPLTESWLDLHDREQLAELAAEWKVPVLEKDSEAEIRKKLTGNPARIMPLPAEIAELIKGTTKGAKSAKRKPR